MASPPKYGIGSLLSPYFCGSSSRFNLGKKRIAEIVKKAVRMKAKMSGRKFTESFFRREARIRAFRNFPYSTIPLFYYSISTNFSGRKLNQFLSRQIAGKNLFRPQRMFRFLPRENPKEMVFEKSRNQRITRA